MCVCYIITCRKSYKLVFLFGGGWKRWEKRVKYDDKTSG